MALDGKFSLVGQGGPFGTKIARDFTILTPTSLFFGFGESPFDAGNGFDYPAPFILGLRVGGVGEPVQNISTPFTNRYRIVGGGWSRSNSIVLALGQQTEGVGWYSLWSFDSSLQTPKIVCPDVAYADPSTQSFAFASWDEKNQQFQVLQSSETEGDTAYQIVTIRLFARCSTHISAPITWQSTGDWASIDSLAFSPTS